MHSIAPKINTYYDEGHLEISIGRIVGHSANAITETLKRANQGPVALNSILIARHQKFDDAFYKVENHIRIHRQKLNGPGEDNCYCKPASLPLYHTSDFDLTTITLRRRCPMVCYLSANLAGFSLFGLFLGRVWSN